MTRRADLPRTRADMLAGEGVLVIVRAPPAAPPPAPGQPPAVHANPAEGDEVLLALWDDGSVTALSGHVDLGTGLQTALAQIVADFHTTYPGWMPGAELHSRLEQADFLADVARETAPGG